MDFIDKPDKIFMILTVSASGLLTPLTSFPNVLKNKSSYFIKKSNVALTAENLRKVLIYGDMSTKPVDELATLIEEVNIN